MAQWSAHGRQPRSGKVLCGASQGAGIFLLLAQTTTDGPGVDVKEFSGVHPVPSCMLEESADDGIVQVTHASAERECEG